MGWGSREEQNFPKEKRIARSVAGCTCEVFDSVLERKIKKGVGNYVLLTGSGVCSLLCWLQVLGAPEECGGGVPWTAGVRAVVVRGQLIKTLRRRKR